MSDTIDNNEPTEQNEDRMNCILYLRVSSEEQTLNFSIQNQREYCLKEAERRGYEIDRIFEELGASAKSITGRPELLKLLAYCEKQKSKISALLVYRLDRLARETSDFLLIRKKLAELGIKIVSCNEPVGNEDTATSRFIETIMASIAELDNSIKGERTKQGLRQRFLQGYPINAPSIGYRYEMIDGKSQAVPHEKYFEIVKRCFETYATGTVSLNELANLANKWGLRIYRKGKANKVRSQSISRILNNDFYRGILKYPKYPEEIQGKHQPVVSDQLFFKVKAILNGKNTLLGNTKKNLANPLFPLRGLIRCTCGANLVSGNCKGNTQYYARYWCNNKHGGIQAKFMEEQLLEQLSFVQPKQECIDLFMIMLQRNYQNRINTLTKFQKDSQRKETEIKDFISKLVEEHLKERVPDETYDHLIQKYENQLLETRIVKNDNIIEKYDLEGTMAFMRALLKNLPKAYEVSNYTQKRILLGSIYPTGLLFDGKVILNSQISPYFRDIRDVSQLSDSLGVLERI